MVHGAEMVELDPHRHDIPSTRRSILENRKLARQGANNIEHLVHIVPIRFQAKIVVPYLHELQQDSRRLVSLLRGACHHQPSRQILHHIRPIYL